ncbi:MAG: FAD-binding oxidoreductase [Acidimicrobiales bacterium]
MSVDTGSGPVPEGDEVAAESSSPDTVRGPKRPPPAWQDAKVLEVVAQTAETTTLRLSLPASSGFAAGQYYNVRLLLPGRPRPVQRAYSVGSSPVPDPSVIEVTVKRMDGGLISPRLVDEVRAGETVAVRGPYGSFIWSAGLAGPVLLVAAGSGVVPLIAMARLGDSVGAEERMRLLFCSKSYDTIIYRDEITRLGRTSWFDCTHTFTRSSGDKRAAFHRRIDRDMLKTWMDGGPSAKLAYICGPPSMVDQCADDLVTLGVDPAGVHTEKYD